MSETFDESYPPSLFSPPAPPVVVPTGATAGAPGAWTPPGSQAPSSLAEANALGLALGPVWAAGQWVDLAGGGDIHWAGAAFVAGVAPVVEDPAPETSQASKRGRRKAEEQ
jgi:hypothetical protein